MSGRYTFTAGNTLTAAQLNTNVMDGIPYKIVAGTATVTGSLAVTFASSFTSGVTPVVTATVVTNAPTTGGTATITQGTPNTGMTVYVWKADGTAATVAKTVHWHATQMTSTTGAGNS
jgi:hypothetical protein